jgi:hypothetical protein
MNVPLTTRLDRDEDPIDVQLHQLGAAPARVRPLPWHGRLGVSWSSGTAPVLLLLLVGMALGPGALALLTPGVLSAIDPAVPVALAVLGAHAGLTLPWPRMPHDRRLFDAASIESVITGLVVGTGVLFLLAPGPAAAPFYAWMVALAAAVCASTSASRADGDAVLTPARQLEHYDVVLPILAGGAVLAWIREGDLVHAAGLFLHAVALALVVAAAAWLLLTRTASDTEQRIFGVSAMLLVGGLADYLSLSALTSGLVAGLFWQRAGGPAAESLRRDLGYLQHPLVVLLLVTAGARTGSLGDASAVAAAYLLLRAVGKLLGAWMALRATRAALPDALGLLLLSPGVFGVAFALNAVRSAGPQAEPLLGIIVLGTLASQLLAAMRRPHEADA